MKKALLLLFAAGLLFGCHGKRAVVKKPKDRQVAAFIAEYPLVVDSEKKEIEDKIKSYVLTDVDASLRERVSRFLSGGQAERERLSKITFNEAGTGRDEVREELQGIRNRLAGVTLRPMGFRETELFKEWRDADMEWARVYGEFILGREPQEVGLVAVGGGLSGSFGLTDWGRTYARENSVETLDTWIREAGKGKGAKVSYVAGLFGAREVVEASVVIVSVLSAIGMLKTRRRIFKRAVMGAGVAGVVSILVAGGFGVFIKSFRAFADDFFLIFGVASIFMFVLVGNVAFHPYYMGGWIGRLRKLAEEHAEKAIFMVAFFAVLREGLEMSVSMTALSLVCGWEAVAKGLVVGFPLGAGLVGLGFGLHRGFFTVRRMLVASGAMMVLAASSFSALFVNVLQQKGYLPIHMFAQGVPTFLTVITGLSGSVETSLAFVLTGAAIVIPWIFVRLQYFRAYKKGREWGAVALGCCLVALAVGPGLVGVAEFQKNMTGGAGNPGWSIVSAREGNKLEKDGALRVVVGGGGKKSEEATRAQDLVVFPDADDRTYQELAEHIGPANVVLHSGNKKDGEGAARKLAQYGEGKVFLIK